MMDQAVKKQWLTELKSGEYIQSKMYLKQVNKNKIVYCCLGVLCELSDGRWDNGIFHLSGGAGQNYSSDELLPTSLRESLGITSIEEGTLTSMNDSGEHDFEDIADWIDENL